MQITIHRAASSLTLELDATERMVSVRGFLIPCDMIGCVRLDVADASRGVPMWQGISNPMERETK